MIKGARFRKLGDSVGRKLQLLPAFKGNVVTKVALVVTPKEMY